MPLPKGEDADDAIPELHEGKTYKRTRKRMGKKKANKQAIAIALANERRGGKKHRKSTRRHRKG